MPPMHSVGGIAYTAAQTGRGGEEPLTDRARSLLGVLQEPGGEYEYQGARMANVSERAAFLVEKTDKGAPVMVKGPLKTEDVPPWQPTRTRSARSPADTRTGTPAQRNTSARRNLPACLRRASPGATCGSNHILTVPGRRVPGPFFGNSDRIVLGQGRGDFHILSRNLIQANGRSSSRRGDCGNGSRRRLGRCGRRGRPPAGGQGIHLTVDRPQGLSGSPGGTPPSVQDLGGGRVGAGTRSIQFPRPSIRPGNGFKSTSSGISHEEEGVARWPDWRT